MFEVYLAKSNRANPNDVANVRALLAKYSDSLKVVEYTGGKFSHKNMLDCELLVIVPDLSEFDEYSDSVSIGKGLHEQIEAFQSQSVGANDAEYPEIIVVTETSELACNVRAFSELDIDDSNNFVKYSNLILEEEDFDLSDVLETIGLTPNSINSYNNYIATNNYMYLLTKN